MLRQENTIDARNRSEQEIARIFDQFSGSNHSLSPPLAMEQHVSGPTVRSVRSGPLLLADVLNPHATCSTAAI